MRFHPGLRRICFLTLRAETKKLWVQQCKNHAFCSGETKKPSRLNYRVRVWSRIIRTTVSCYYRSCNFANMSLAAVCGQPSIIVMPWQDIIKSCRTGVHSHMHFGDEMGLMIIIIQCSIMSPVSLGSLA